MTELTPDGRSLFASARAGLAPSAADRARNQQRLAVQLGTAAASVTESATLAKAVTAKAALGKGFALSGPALAKWSWLGLALAIGAGIALTWAVAPKSVKSLTRQPGASSTGSVPATSPTALPTANTNAATPPESPPNQGALPAPSGSGHSALGKVRRSSQPQATTKASVAEESRLLRSADAALRDGDSLRALALLDQHAQQFPNGVLAEERSLERISTLCRLGRTSAAQEEFRRFGWGDSDSPLASVARSSCVK